ncbi:MAG: hypothetical protein LBE79_10875 [Tannerella sp.]|jgi:hypothetical protein|nr:hypothetical protein [Tannerella sp.]
MQIYIFAADLQSIYRKVNMCFITGSRLKKVIALSFLMIAGIILLVHAVIPHHHHGGISCISYATHKQDGNSTDDDAHEDCLLTKVCLRWSNDKQNFNFHDFDFVPLLCTFILFSEYSSFQIKDDIGLLLREKPYLHGHTELITRSTGLRAPPVC